MQHLACRGAGDAISGVTPYRLINGGSMADRADRNAERCKSYRQRQRKEGRRPVLIYLPADLVAWLDTLRSGNRRPRSAIVAEIIREARPRNESNP